MRGKLVLGVDDGVGGEVMVGCIFKLFFGCFGVVVGVVEVVINV